MSRVDHLIRELCPNGVEFKELHQVFDLRNGYTPSKSDKSFWEGGTVPWFRMEDIRENGGILDDSIQHVTASAVKGGRLFAANSIIVATSATIGSHALIRVPFLSNQRFTCMSLKPEYADRLDSVFIYYYCYVLDEWCTRNTTRSSFSSVDMTGFKRFRFPLPPVDVQREIVRLLDLSTSLEKRLRTELEAERDARLAQHKHYRETLLHFSEAPSVRTMSLGEAVYNLDSQRRPVTRAARQSGPIPYYGANGVQDYVHEHIFDGTFLLMGEDGSVVQKDGRPVLNWATGKIWVNNHAHVLTQKHKDVNLRYIYHYLRTVDIRQYVTGGLQPKLNKGNLERIVVAVPSLEEQEHIVEVLDRLDSLVAELSESLPSEVTARRKQYVHYRNQLLTFPEMVA